MASYLSYRNVLLSNSTVIASTLNAGSVSYSTLTGSTMSTRELTVSTLTGSTIQGTTVFFSTMTASTILTAGSTISLARNVNVPNRFLEIGCDLADSMYLDFHSKDSALPDYSTRIISQGGATTGTGGLNMYASTIGLMGTNGVGIGTTAPTAILSVLEAPVNGDVSRKNMFLGFRNATGGVQNAVSMALALGPNVSTVSPYGSLDIKLNGAPIAGNNYGAIPDITVMSIIGNGNVGIGTTAPTAALHIKNATTAMRITGNLTNASTRPAVSTTPGTFEIRGSGATDGADDGFLRLSAGGGSSANQQAYIDLSGYSTVADMSSNIVFGAQGTERMRITYTALQVASGLTTDLGGALKTGYNTTGLTAASLVANVNGTRTGPSGSTYTFTTSGTNGSLIASVANIPSGSYITLSITCNITAGSGLAAFFNGTNSYVTPTLTSSMQSFTFQFVAGTQLLCTIVSATGTVFNWNAFSVQRLDTNATGFMGVGTPNPDSLLTLYGSTPAAIAPTLIGQWKAQHTIYATGSYALKLGANYTAGVGAYSSIQSTEYYDGTEHPGYLNLNPIGGLVGIGVTNPSQPLDVNGAIQTKSLNNCGIVISPGNGNFGVIECFNYTSALFNTVKYPLCLNAYGGNVGIGKTNPSEKLDVAGGIRAVNGVYSYATTFFYYSGNADWNTQSIFGDPSAWPWGGNTFLVTLRGPSSLAGNAVRASFIVFHSRNTAGNDNYGQVTTLSSAHVSYGISDYALRFTFNSPSAQTVNINILVLN